jgi:hypothetical protein
MANDKFILIGLGDEGKNNFNFSQYHQDIKDLEFKND